jgi:hypothetical protein
VSGLFLRIAIALVRVWTIAYTSGLPPAVRAVRRAEIESDLSESQRERSAGTWLPIEIVSRLLRGIWDDLGWRVEQKKGCLDVHRATIVLTLTAAAVFAALWMTFGTLLLRTPQLPPSVTWHARWERQRFRPPPPPPPPPCAPPDLEPPAVAFTR